MRVLQVLPCRFFGGPEKQTLRLSGTLRSRYGYDTTFAVMPEGNRASGLNPLLERASAEGFSGFELVHWNRYDPISGVAALKRIVASVRPDIVCSAGYKANLLSCALREVATVAMVRGWTGASAKIRIFESVERGVLRFHHSVGVVSRSQISNVLKCGVREEKIFYIPNSVQVVANSGHRMRQKLRSELGLSDRDLMIGAVGRLSVEKGQDVLIDAFFTVSRHMANCHLVLVGDGPFDRTLRTRVAALGIQDRVHFLGLRENGSEIMQGFDILALPSRTEGMPNVVLEAFAGQVPVVATAVGSVPEMIGNDDAGWQVPPGEVGPFARALLEALTDRSGSDRRAREGLRRVLQDYSTERQADAFVEAARNALEGASE